MEFRRFNDYREMIEMVVLAFSFEKKNQGTLEEYLKSLESQGKRFYGIYDGETIVAGCIVFPYKMRLRQSFVPMAGIAMVCSRQDYRGKGGIRQLFTELLLELRKDFKVSVLYPFSRDFYRKYGWEVFDRWQYVKFSPGSLTEHESTGIDASDMAFPDFDSISFYKEYARTHFNCTLRSEVDWKERLSPVWPDQVDKRIVKFSKDEKVVGILDNTLGFNQKEDTSFHSIFTFASQNEEARNAMFTYLRRLSHQVKEVRMWLPQHFEIWPYINESPQEHHLRETSMIRIVDLKRLNGLEILSEDVRIDMKIEDSQCSWNDGNYRLEIKDNALSICEGGTPQIEIGIGSLSTVISGRESLSRMVELGRAKALAGYVGENIRKSEVFFNETF